MLIILYKNYKMFKYNIILKFIDYLMKGWPVLIMILIHHCRAVSANACQFRENLII